jgi:hypothetical protein
MKSMLRILAVVPFLCCWSGASAAPGSPAGVGWSLDFVNTFTMPWSNNPCVGESLTIEATLSGWKKPLSTPSGRELYRYLLRLEGTATGDKSHNLYIVRAQEMDGLHVYTDGSTNSTQPTIWWFTPVEDGVKFSWTGYVLHTKWSGMPYDSNLLFIKAHNYEFNDWENWGSYTHCMGKGK